VRVCTVCSQGQTVQTVHTGPYRVFLGVLDALWRLLGGPDSLFQSLYQIVCTVCSPPKGGRPLGQRPCQTVQTMPIANLTRPRRGDRTWPYTSMNKVTPRSGAMSAGRRRRSAGCTRCGIRESRSRSCARVDVMTGRDDGLCRPWTWCRLSGTSRSGRSGRVRLVEEIRVGSRCRGEPIAVLCRGPMVLEGAGPAPRARETGPGTGFTARGSSYRG